YGYYYMFAFFLIFIVSKIIIQIIVSGFDYFQQVTTGGLVTSIGGIILGIVETIYILVVVLVFVATIPYTPVQEAIANSGLANFIIDRSEEHTSELQSRFDLVCRLL